MAYKNHDDAIQHGRKYRQTERYKVLRASWPSNCRKSGYKPSLKTRFKILIQGALRRSLEVSITLDEYSAIISTGICSYCSRILPDFGHGVDRKDNTLGYTLENSAPCCAECNDIKRDTLTFDEMVWLMARRKAEGRV